MAFPKFKALVHHVIHECASSPDQLGAIRLNKVLWFADVTAYKMDGRAITGEKYVKRQFGPAPSRVLRALDDLVREGAVLILDPEVEYAPRKFYALTAPASGKLSNREKLITSAVLDDVLGRTASEISEMSHDDVWQAAEIGEEIPMYATLASTPGEITEDVVEWANSSLAENTRAA